MSEEILRLVDTIHRSKEIDKEIIFQGIEAALLSAVRKKQGDSEETRVIIDRNTGETRVFEGEQEIGIENLGRLAAMSGKQVLFQKIREAERDRIYEEFEAKIGKLVAGIVQRAEGPNLIVNLGKVEGILPRSEQAPGERFKVGERIKVLVKDIKKNTHRVKIALSRTSPELVRALFELEVPEIAEKVIEIMEIAREPGYRTKIAVTTYDHNVDCVGACVGVRGSRIKNIVDELFGEKIDIVRWNDSIEVLIMNALKPAEISSIDLDFETQKAIVYVKSDQQSLAIGKRGQNVRLASKLCKWDIDIKMVTEEELEKLRRGEPEDEAAAVPASTDGAPASSAEASSAEASSAEASSAEASSAEAEPPAGAEQSETLPAAEPLPAEVPPAAAAASETLATEELVPSDLAEAAGTQGTDFADRQDSTNEDPEGLRLAEIDGDGRGTTIPSPEENDETDSRLREQQLDAKD
jgi:N utilization substance protein A